MDEHHSYLLVEREGAILTLTLNNPEKSNSLHPEMVNRLSAVLDEVAASEEIIALIITGAGKHFCAGLDLSLLMNWAEEEKTAYLRRVTEIFDKIWRLPQPVIAAVNGAAIAGGFDLAAFCDIRLAARKSVFGQAEINVGLVQIIHPLYKTIGLARAKELAMLGEPISAEEAYRIGLINHVYESDELMSQAHLMARKLAAKPRLALFETKRLTRELIDLDTQTALEEIRATLRRCFNTEEHKFRVAEILRSLKKP